MYIMNELMSNCQLKVAKVGTLATYCGFSLDIR